MNALQISENDELEEDPMFKFVNLHLVKFQFHLTTVLKKLKTESDDEYIRLLFRDYVRNLQFVFNEILSDIDLDYQWSDDEEEDTDCETSSVDLEGNPKKPYP